MPSPFLEELSDSLQTLADPDSLSRGADYARDGRVEILDLTRDALKAHVLGKHGYTVEISYVDGHLDAHCSCPLGMRDVFCKHCVATVLAALARETEAAAAQGDVRALEAVARGKTQNGPLLATQAQFDAFVKEHQIEHVRFFGAEVLGPHLPEHERTSARYVLTRHRLTDFATSEGMARYGTMLGHAPRLRAIIVPSALLYLRTEAETAARVRQEIAKLRHLPVDAEVRDLFSALLGLRDQHDPAIAPRPAEALPTDRLRFDEVLPGFEWTEPQEFSREQLYAVVRPSVSLTLTASGAKAKCSTCRALCFHTLGATDAALRMLLEPLSDERRAELEQLRRPAWERALLAIDRAVDAASRPTTPVSVSWRLTIFNDNDTVVVQPYLHRLTKKGAFSAGSRIAASKLLDDEAEHLGTEDRQLAWLASRTYGPAPHALLVGLAGHPRVVMEADPSTPVQVEVAKLGLMADERGGTVVLLPALDGAPLPERFAERLRRPGDANRPLFLYEEAAHRLTVLEAPLELRRTIEVLAKYGNDFPPESHAALVEKLSTMSARLPVAMPRTVMGEAVPPQTHPVLRLEVQPDGGVRGEVRIRPLPESAAFVPGDGARDVHVRRNGKPVHARRDFEAEQQAATRVLEQLRIRDVPWEPPASFDLPDPQRALALLATLKELEHPPEVEWLGSSMRLIGRAQTSALRVTLEHRRDWFGAKGGLSVEGERIALAVLLDSARRKERFVKVADQTYVEVEEALRRHLERLADHAWTSGHGVEIGVSAADALQALGDGGAVLEADQAWRKLVERIFAAKDLRPKVPRALKATLRDYQREGYEWLSRLAAWGAGAVLADDMGLGKTVQSLAVLLERAKLGPALVVAPTSVGFNWVDEAKRFAPKLQVRLYAESEDRGGALAGLGPNDVLVLSYGLLARDVQRLAKVRFATLVFDEAQALKNASTHRARAAQQLQADFKFALSGTPLENHLGELWSIFRIVFPGLLGSWEAFRERFAIPIEKRIDPTAAPALGRVLQPFLLRRTKGQVAQELPARTDLRVPVVLSQTEWQLYEDARLAAISDLETPKDKLREQQRRVQVLAALTRLRMLASHPRLYDPRSDVRSSKLERLLELIDELRAEGHRALVFSQFTSHLALVREALDERGYSYLYLDGATPAGERRARVKTFQEGDAPLFLISLKAGGFGLNLTGADNVIHLDPWWNPAVEDQASDRAHRIGQHRPVTVYRLVAKGTIEEQILSLHEEKRRLVNDVLEGKEAAGRLSTKELLDLLSSPAAPLAKMESPSSAKH